MQFGCSLLCLCAHAGERRAARGSPALSAARASCALMLWGQVQAGLAWRCTRAPQAGRMG